MRRAAVAAGVWAAAYGSCGLFWAAGGGGYRNSLTPSVLTQPAYIDRELVETRVTMVRA